MILSPTSQISHHHKVTNITVTRWISELNRVYTSSRNHITVIDRYGIFVGRCISSSMSLLGFVLLTMAIQHPILLWISWPLIASGGLASHMTNMPMARSIPLLSSAFQALTAGFISGGAGVPIIWGMMHKTLDYQIIFVIWLILGSTVTITKIILFSPKRLQKKITETGINQAQTLVLRSHFGTVCKSVNQRFWDPC